MLRKYQEVFLKLKFTLSYTAKLINWGIWMQIISFAVILIFMPVSIYDMLVIKNWFIIEIKNYILGFFHKPLIEYNEQTVIEAVKNLYNQLKLPLMLSFAGWLVPLLMHISFKRDKSKHIEEKQIAGSELLPVAKLIKKLKNQTSKLIIGGLQNGFILTNSDDNALRQNPKQEKEYRKAVVPIPFESENRHFLIIGAPGSGKTVLLNPVIEQLKARQEKLIVHDFKGDMVTKFYNPLTDFIFNPLDKRCIKWNIWNDIDDEIDIRSIAASLFVSNSKEDPFWNDAAKDVFEAILIYLLKNKLTTNADIWEHINLPAAKIKDILASDPDTMTAIRYIQDADSKQTQGVLSKLNQMTKCFRYLKDIDGNFSIKEWVKSYKDSTIFLVNYADVKDTIAPAITLFIDIAAKATLTLIDDLNRRIFFFLDEFGQLKKMTSLIDILTNGRSKGVSIWLAIQDIGQIDNIYGYALKKTIINALNNYIIFGLNDPDTAKFFTEKIGERKLLTTDEMIHHDAHGETEQMGVRKSQKIEKLMMASDLMNLQEREALIKLSTVQEYSKIKVYVKHFIDVAQRLVR